MTMTRREMLAVAAAGAGELRGKTSPELPLVVVVGATAPGSPKGYRVLAIPSSGGAVFPPQGVAYRENAEAHRIWRTIHAAGPSLVVDAAGLTGLAKSLEGKAPVVSGLPKSAPEPSELAKRQAARLTRSPHELAEQLGRVYGHVLTDVTYQLTLACMGRMRLGAVADIEELVAPYVDGRRDSLARQDSTMLPGHLLFAELYERTKKRVYLERLVAAAKLGFTADGAPKEAMPFHNEMSDSVFMGCPLLGQAARLTGEARYRAMAVRHLRFMEGLGLRPDGLYRHSPLCEAAWGRGNAFPALGMALLLEASATPDPHVVDSFRKLLRALTPYQDGDGMWHEVVDRPDSYAEFTATAMIGAAMMKGMRGGWIGRATYEPAVERAWAAIQRRTAEDGVVMDVCESTGKQKTVEAYLDRAAIWDRDPRGGAMAMLLATERMQGLRRG